MDAFPTPTRCKSNKTNECKENEKEALVKVEVGVLYRVLVVGVAGAESRLRTGRYVGGFRWAIRSDRVVQMLVKCLLCYLTG